MDDTSFQQFFNNIDIFLEFPAINYQRSNWKLSIMDKSRSYFMVVYAFVCIILNINGFFYRNDVESWILALLDIISFFLALTKANTIYRFTNQMRNLKVDILRYTKIEAMENSAQKEILQRYHQIYRLVSKAMRISYICAGAFYMVFPFLVKIFGGQWILPTSAKIFFISTTTNSGYLIHYLVQVSTLIYNLTAVLSFDLTICMYSIYIAYRLDLCRYHTKKIGDPSNLNQHDLIMKCVRLHGETFRFIKICSKIMSAAVVAQIAMTVGLLTLAMFYYMITPFNQAYTHLLGLGGVLFLYCYCGELVVTKSAKVAETLYNSQWENLLTCKEQMKIILFFLTNAQQKTCFAAMEIYELSYETFTNTVKAAVGYALFLQKVFF